MSLPVTLIDPRDYNPELAQALKKINLFELLSQRKFLTNITAMVLHFASARGPQCIQITSGAFEQVKEEILQKIIRNIDLLGVKQRLSLQITGLPRYTKDLNQTPIILPLLLVKDNTSHAVQYLQRTPKFDELFKTFLPSLARMKSKVPEINEAVQGLGNLGRVMDKFVKLPQSETMTEIIFPDIEFMLSMAQRDSQYDIIRSYTSSFTYLLDWISQTRVFPNFVKPPISLVEMEGKFSDLLVNASKWEKLQKMKIAEPTLETLPIVQDIELAMYYVEAIAQSQSQNIESSQSIILQPQVQHLTKELRKIQDRVTPTTYTMLMEIVEILNKIFHQEKYAIYDFSRHFWTERMLTSPRVIFTMHNIVPRFEYIRTQHPFYERELHSIVYKTNNGTVNLFHKFMNDLKRVNYSAMTFMPDMNEVMSVIEDKDFLKVLRVAFPATAPTGLDSAEFVKLSQVTMPFALLPTVSAPTSVLNTSALKKLLESNEIEFTGMYQSLPVTADLTEMKLDFQNIQPLKNQISSDSSGLGSLVQPRTHFNEINSRSFQGTKPFTSQEPLPVSSKVLEELHALHTNFRHKFKLKAKEDEFQATEALMIPLTLTLPNKNELTQGDEQAITLLHTFLKHMSIEMKSPKLHNLKDYLKHLLTIRAESELSASDNMLSSFDLWRFVKGNVDLFLRLEFVLTILKFYKISYVKKLQQFVLVRVKAHGKLDYTDLFEQMVYNPNTNAGFHVSGEENTKIILEKMIANEPSAVTVVPYGKSDGKIMEIGIEKGDVIKVSGRSLWTAVSQDISQISLQTLATVESVRRLLYCVQFDSHMILNTEMWQLIWATEASMLHVSSGWFGDENSLNNILTIIQTSAVYYDNVLNIQDREALVLRVLSNKIDSLSEDIFEIIFPICPSNKAYLHIQKYGHDIDIVSWIQLLRANHIDVLAEFRNFILEHYAPWAKIMDTFLETNFTTAQDRNIILLALITFLCDLSSAQDKCFFVRKSLQSSLAPVTVSHVPGLDQNNIHFDVYVDAAKHIDFYNFGLPLEEINIKQIPDIVTSLKSYLNDYGFGGIFSLVTMNTKLINVESIVRAYLVAINATLIIARQNTSERKTVSQNIGEFPDDFWNKTTNSIDMEKLRRMLNTVSQMYYNFAPKKLDYLKPFIAKSENVSLCNNLAFLLQVNNMPFTAREFRKRPTIYTVLHLSDINVLWSECQKAMLHLV